MSEFYSYEGLRDGGTFVVDATTKAAIENDPTEIIGKVVTITGNNQVGYGTSGDPPRGVVEMVEKEVSNSDNLVVSVVWHQMKEDIPASGVTANDWVACDGNGGVTKSSTPTMAWASAFDDDHATVMFA